MSGILVSYQGTPAALVGVRQFSFLGDVRHLPPRHPVVRMVTHMSYYAHLVLAGEMPVSYTDADAERFARLALIDPDELALHETDEVLAARFRVPTDEVIKARKELEAADGH